MGNLTKGEVVIHLAGEARTLKPSLEAFERISLAGGYRQLCARITAYEVASIVYVVRHGLEMSDAEAKALPRLLFENGVTTLAAPTAEFVFRLFNAGMSPAELDAAMDAEAGGATEGKPPLG